MKNVWEKEGNNVCPLCKKGVAQLYSDNVDGKYTTGCWKCVYKR